MRLALMKKIKFNSNLEEKEPIIKILSSTTKSLSNTLKISIQNSNSSNQFTNRSRVPSTYRPQLYIRIFWPTTTPALPCPIWTISISLARTPDQPSSIAGAIPPTCWAPEVRVVMVTEAAQRAPPINRSATTISSPEKMEMKRVKRKKRKMKKKKKSIKMSCLEFNEILYVLKVLLLLLYYICEINKR